VVSFTPRPLYPQGKSPWYPLDRKLGEPQSRSGRGGEEKNSQPPPAIEPSNLDRPARSPALYRLSCHGSLVILHSCKFRNGLNIPQISGQWKINYFLFSQMSFDNICIKNLPIVGFICMKKLFCLFWYMFPPKAKYI
jgi:hypothetical protein